MTDCVELCLPVTELGPAVRLWSAHGFTPADIGEIPASETAPLYGVEAGLRSVRLAHASGFGMTLRLMCWQPATKLAPRGSDTVLWPVFAAADPLALLQRHDAAARLIVLDAPQEDPLADASQERPVVAVLPAWRALYLRPASTTAPPRAGSLGVGPLLGAVVTPPALPKMAESQAAPTPVSSLLAGLGSTATALLAAGRMDETLGPVGWLAAVATQALPGAASAPGSAVALLSAGRDGTAPPAVDEFGQRCQVLGHHGGLRLIGPPSPETGLGGPDRAD